MRRKVNSEGGEGGVGVMLRWVKIGKWSDTVIKDCDIVGERFVWEEVINEVQCMIMYVSRDINIFGEVSGWQ